MFLFFPLQRLIKAVLSWRIILLLINKKMSKKIIRSLILISVFLVICFTDGTAQSKQHGQKKNHTNFSAEGQSAHEVDPLTIVEGKILSWAVSSDDEIAYTPPGKWANVYGKTYYRYVERANGAAIKVNEVAASAANILTPEQLEIIVSIVADQTTIETKGLANRSLIARELIKWREGDKGDENKILKLANENGILFKKLVLQSASAFGKVFQSLTIEQKSALSALRKSSDHASSGTRSLSVLDQSLSKEEHTVLRILLCDFFIWATGTEEMNRYIDSGRPAVFFGFANLRVKNRAGKNVSSGLRGEASKVIEKLLDSNQKVLLDQLIVNQANLLDSYYNERGDLAGKLMAFQLANSIIDENVISDLCVSSEVVEAKLAIVEAKGMAFIIQSLTPDQMKVLQDFKANKNN
jgi:hypothetical protein